MYERGWGGCPLWSNGCATRVCGGCTKRNVLSQFRCLHRRGATGESTHRRTQHQKVSHEPGGHGRVNVRFHVNVGNVCHWAAIKRILQNNRARFLPTSRPWWWMQGWTDLPLYLWRCYSPLPGGSAKMYTNLKPKRHTHSGETWSQPLT